MRFRLAICTGLASMALGSGCGVDLGTCDENALDGNAQAVIQRSCASGRCHSQGATGTLRHGAPAGLDFDVLPLDTSTDAASKVLRAITVVREWRDEMWDQIDGGDMPPSGFGSTLAGEEKEHVRNWLACNAPPVATAGMVVADWSSIYTVIEDNCLACHAVGNAVSGANVELGAAGDPCGALTLLLGTASTTETCGGQAFIDPGNAAGSLLYNKLLDTPDPCGERMPFFQDPLPSETIEAIRMWIDNGANATCP